METMIETALKIFGITTLRYFIIAGIPFIAFYLIFPYRLRRFKIQQKLASTKDFIREVWHSLQSTFIFALVTAAVLFTPVRQYTLIYSNINDFPIWYLAISVVASLILHDTYFYWMHRVLHHKTLFKHAHVLHHRSTNPSPWASYSFHLFEAIAEGLVLVPIAFLLPMHPIAIMLFAVIGFAINVYGHLGYKITPKWFRYTWLFQVFNTSVHHNLHHSKFKGNYGLYFRFWDRLMGTEHSDYVKQYDQLQAQRFGATAEKRANVRLN